MAKKTKRFHGMAFPSGRLMSEIPITEEYAKRMLARVREEFHNSSFRPKIKFDHRASGSWGVYGEADYRENTITLWRKGMNVETLLHEIAHILTRCQGHNKDFYEACAILERELFYCEWPQK